VARGRRRSVAVVGRRCGAVAVVLGLALLAGACGRGAGGAPEAALAPSGPAPVVSPSPSPTAQPSPLDEPGAAAATSPPAPPARPDLAGAAVALTPVATVDSPTALAPRAGDPALYVTERGGRVRVLRGGEVDPDPLLDISAETRTDGEFGLLGLAFSPDGTRLYLHFNDRAGDTLVHEWTMDGDAVRADSRRAVLVVDQPRFGNHKGGQLSFGPDGLLYLGLGDGGSQGDPDRNGQDLGTLLGKVLRIDPAPRDGAAYGVPADNPFAGQAGARGEIWVYGLRNPWRFSFDRLTGDLWIGDVGQDEIEEIDFLPAGQAAGADLGWSSAQGSRPYHGPVTGVPPITEYTHDEGCSVTGGYVYRGRALPALHGAYLFGDFCSGRIWAVAQEGGQVAERAELAVVDQVVSFGEDADGELYALSLNGAVLRIDPA
jgi:glucose/arabinose dehydrogenase